MSCHGSPRNPLDEGKMEGVHLYLSALPRTRGLTPLVVLPAVSMKVMSTVVFKILYFSIQNI